MVSEQAKSQLGTRLLQVLSTSEYALLAETIAAALFTRAMEERARYSRRPWTFEMPWVELDAELQKPWHDAAMQVLTIGAGDE